MSVLDLEAPFEQMFAMARILRHDIIAAYQYNNFTTKVIYPTSLDCEIALFQLGEEEKLLSGRNNVELRNHIRTRFNKVNSTAANIGFRISSVIRIDGSDVIGISGNPMNPDLVWSSSVSRILVKGCNLREEEFIRQFENQRRNA